MENHRAFGISPILGSHTACADILVKKALVILHIGETLATNVLKQLQIANHTKITAKPVVVTVSTLPVVRNKDDANILVFVFEAVGAEA